MLAHKSFNPALYDRFLAKVLLLQNALKMDGHVFYLFSGMRTHAEQMKLWTLGRTVRNPDGASEKKPLGNIVTNAKPGQSLHNFGLSVDLVYDLNGGKGPFKPSWDAKYYSVIGPKAKELGLEWGGDWKFTDLPHVQWDLERYKLTLKDLQAAYNKDGLQAVKELLDLKLGSNVIADPHP